MGTTTQTAPQETDLYGTDIMSNMNPSDWNNLIGTIMPPDDKFQLQQYINNTEHINEYIEHSNEYTDTIEYINQMQPPPPLQPYRSRAIPSTYMPSRDEYAGDRNFEIVLSKDITGANCAFSKELGKVFINVDQPLPIRFKWRRYDNDKLCLRGMIVYSSDQYRADPIRRCLNHQSEDNHYNRNMDPSALEHVVRCTDPQTIYVEYHNHKCILVSLGTPQHGSDYVPLTFKFYCKNSCAGGMNRRGTGVIFTLEDELGNVLGRRFLPVRVCSCPKRDMDKEKESIFKKLNKQSMSSSSSSSTSTSTVTAPVPAPKRRKVTPKIPCPPGKRPITTMTTMTHMIPAEIDNREFNLSVRVLGRDNAIATLKAAHGAMSSEATMTGQLAPFNPYLKDIEKHIQQLQ